MQLTAEQITNLLTDEYLLQETPDFKGVFTHLAYNSNDVQTGTLLFIKGNFKPEYLVDAMAKGVQGIVAPVGFVHDTDLPTWTVDEVMPAMSILSMAFYGNPQQQLSLIGITGTKGKTSSTYMAYEILKQATGDRVALSSTLEVITGNDAEHHYRAKLTTPESVDLFRWMREAVDNKMTHMVMEVSSQAYKLDRVYGLRFNVGVFLNISEDHIGPNEHASFEEYLMCKEMLLEHSDQAVINADSAYFEDVVTHTAEFIPRDGVWLYGRGNDEQGFGVDVSYTTLEETLQGSEFNVDLVGPQAQSLKIDGDFKLDMPGDFNQGNAVAAMLATRLVGADADAMHDALEIVKIPGRMQVLTTAEHGTIYVDYAHNYASVAALLQFAKTNAAVEKLSIVVGAPGNKGVSRRPGIGQAVNEGADIVYLTSDDPQFESPEAIADEIQASITDGNVVVHREFDRTKAISDAIAAAGPNDVVILAGKGLDEYQKIDGVDTPYENDWAIAQRIVQELEGAK
ncbi:UDP-N-acetylmuramoyl-L-alanyl-D-glutamate--2,6-diaminopimelate ligase [Weissella tructae]|uniref:UDP-N-acetylmuramyl-tripeptide synthetase n=2 Tax=Weissella TaxID=46255 RepID=A0A075TZK9_9LACO|nr:MULTISPECIES: UDP-N-acetylmuramoyl-L-alanyl-D-glutamate--2,6-diaminopimelate ligase [Weissella]AIG65750.1 UDP-N-acetylmuramyl-tripeptide synthetase [Weissella tructae]AIM63129.1 UDP-N-acetylmuramyl-tripeptide synthetase [Weissella ceti]AIM64465.1 UDP-N-acetylmuramyl-tripeptide synthetase [Weissella ceti]ELA06797.1 UDP-N-acetylmuramoyl-L-alanyl-D-glutamate--lysine ligase [Weissella ceti NC36]QVV90913.1 UDP-N-acetylmuramoyl-L-alanyl-D-glutamate--2,6-diaminopimelate ligase [Weissella tructae]